ncbi:Maf family nucleotide pyrophosphatase [Stenotrophomonas sp. HITSZ_GD]|uniref:Maf family nucleotide pyrophosphatase n=1 Tax=Stenotrophomonas sp. HITSZ_GD TaxID=3037248 RepID=UPI00240E0BA9|nr:Maf family nucleotide pyrophosphatase [Stenotrophomonas sp. HITSZ_GD]MDG2524462.1 Maf family nucleotide pyrophosphatase [Stenotrophomonas sp. HITSZ_GD]
MLWLASRSPRRSELLQRLAIPFQVVDLDVPEVRGADEPAHDYVRRVALDKARAGLAAVRERDPDARVLGADTEVILGQRVFGKPADAQDAAAMLRALSGQAHDVVTALALVEAGGREQVDTVVSRVRFAPLDEATIAAYVATGEPMGKAGAYAIQGRAESFVQHLEGSYSGVMGLPLHQTAQLLNPHGAP